MDIRKIIIPIMVAMLLSTSVSSAQLVQFSPEYRILRYMWKVQTYGVTGSHLKAMVESGDDYKKLAGLGYNKTTWYPVKDAVIDPDKLKDVFVAKGLMTTQEYDDAVTSLRQSGYMESNTMTVTGSGVAYFTALEDSLNQKPPETGEASSTAGFIKGSTAIFSAIGTVLVAIITWIVAIIKKKKQA